MVSDLSVLSFRNQVNPSLSGGLSGDGTMRMSNYSSLSQIIVPDLLSIVSLYIPVAKFSKFISSVNLITKVPLLFIR